MSKGGRTMGSALAEIPDCKEHVSLQSALHMQVVHFLIKATWQLAQRKSDGTVRVRIVGTAQV